MSRAEQFDFAIKILVVVLLKAAGKDKRAKQLAETLVKDWDRAHGGEPQK